MTKVLTDPNHGPREGKAKAAFLAATIYPLVVSARAAVAAAEVAISTLEVQLTYLTVVARESGMDPKAAYEALRIVRSAQDGIIAARHVAWVESSSLGSPLAGIERACFDSVFDPAP